MAAELKTKGCMGCGIEDELVLDYFTVKVDDLDVEIPICANDQRRYHAGDDRPLQEALEDVATYLVTHCR